MRTAIVTGGGAGIGRETALLLARTGYRVVIADIDADSAHAAADEIGAAGGRAHPYRLDVASESQWDKCAEWVSGEFGPAHVLVNNAGVMDTGGFFETTAAQWQRTVDIDLMSVIYGSRVFARQMIDAGIPGHIVNVSSGAAFFPAKYIPAYATAKAAVLMATQALRVELRPKGIGVSAICPGAIRTDLLAHGERAGLDAAQQAAWRTEIGRVQGLAFAGPDKVARAIERAIRRDHAIVPVNLEAWLGYGAFRLSPSLTRVVGSLGSFTLADALLPRLRPLLNRITK
ncbi:SDR family NAD(P)-dependent oxidoreductase [Nocardia brasiliensis]|uniref:Oxidoreductase ephD n=1 Tax=Nocardia brasiliensis (strain ATCC 700358 / HUJEG-1) TaxID=1133849 RepID=K0EWK9_NOCB7|nr:SDR family NAD(P)-dependent oxidoreductase [Nocardia brasiliensis]AFU01847.1 oxidoreductase ephD [Nocardia brasiliensis ATCC 700358]OCF89319.1 oxidoreductase [Nocardia brasiliensis]